MKKSDNRLEVLAAGMLDRSRQLLITILILNMTCNIVIFIISTAILHHVHDQFGQTALALASLLPVLIVTYFGEVFPKVVGRTFNRRIAPWVAVPLTTLLRVLWPVIKVIQIGVMTPVHRLVGVRKKSESFSTDEIREMLEMSEHQGVIDVSENELLQEVVRLREVKVRDVMTPRVDLAAYNINDPPEKAFDLIRQTLLTKLPVYDGQIDNILGVVYSRLMWLEGPGIDIRKFIEPVLYVPEFQMLEQVLGLFRKNRTQMAIVVDEFGGVVGLITLEDVVEQMVGEIYNPHDEAAPAVRKIAADQYMVAGDLSVVDWTDAFGVRVEMSGTSTVAGLLATMLKRIPRVGDAVKLDHLEMQVESMRGKRVDKVRLIIGDTPVAGAGTGAATEPAEVGR
jgi:putative hemolysin